MPTTSGEEEIDDTEGAEDRHASQFPALTHQLEPQLITFSTVPKPKWQTLANLDAIKVRDKADLRASQRMEGLDKSRRIFFQ